MRAWQYCIETRTSLGVWKGLVRAFEARNDGEYGLFPAEQVGEWESVLEECAWDTADPDIVARTLGLVEDLRHAVEIVPGVESFAVGPSLLIDEVKTQVDICRMSGDGDWQQDIELPKSPEGPWG
jgi:hypothetical protein